MGIIIPRKSQEWAKFYLIDNISRQAISVSRQSHELFVDIVESHGSFQFYLVDDQWAITSVGKILDLEDDHISGQNVTPSTQSYEWALLDLVENPISGLNDKPSRQSQTWALIDLVESYAWAKC